MLSNVLSLNNITVLLTGFVIKCLMMCLIIAWGIVVCCVYTWGYVYLFFFTPLCESESWSLSIFNVLSLNERSMQMKCIDLHISKSKAQYSHAYAIALRIRKHMKHIHQHSYLATMRDWIILLGFTGTQVLIGCEQKTLLLEI